MESINLIKNLQKKHKGALILTGLAALQSPAVQTKQLTFFNPRGVKEDYHIGPFHIFIRRAAKKNLTITDHILFIARHLELYADEAQQIVSILPEISLTDIKAHDKAWRSFAYLKKHCLGESIPPKKTIGRRYIDLGDIKSQDTITDSELFVRDALFVPGYRAKSKIWEPQILKPPDPKPVDTIVEECKKYFKTRSIRPLFHRFCRYASRLESAASAKIEGYDARVDASALSKKIQQRMKSNIALRVNLNMDNLHRDIAQLSKESFSIDLLCNIQEAIVEGTWRDEEEKADKTPGVLRPFGEVIVDRSRAGEDNVVFIAPKAKDVPKLLRELIDFYYRARPSMHPLDLAAIFKCQLVIIHPFGDGNGRLGRWCFQSILIREGYIESAHQAPISHIFLEEKNRYYDELARVDESVMEHASCEIDPSTRRYRAIYDDVDIYRSLDYSPWISYIYDSFSRALNFSIEEHEIFERTGRIFERFAKAYPDKISPGQEHEILRAIDIGFRNVWGKKTERRLINNGISAKWIAKLKELTCD